MSDQPPPGPLTRRGPRPLLLHLALAMMRTPPDRSSGSPAASRTSNGGSRSSNAGDIAERLKLLGAAIGPASPSFDGMQSLVDTGHEGLQTLVAGIAAYRRHPWQRDLPDVPVLWREGGSRLLDYGGEGPTVLFVPSLVNRAHVLDLAPGRSMTRHLSANGLRVLLLDWGWPGKVERNFSMSDYVAGRLERAIVAAGENLTLAGYCMGGLLTVAAALRRPDRVRALALLATPWDFHAGDTRRAKMLGAMLPLLEPAMSASASLSIDTLQMMFAMLEPEGIAAKYRAFANLDPASDRARNFVALEDWLNDGVPLAAPVARECLAGWYGENTPANAAWRILGETVDPSRLAMPTLVAVPSRDRIVPPESASPLARLIPGAVAINPAAGHIGMAAGSTAERVLWTPLRDWVIAHAA